MPSPFPGMNPYLEDQALWPAFHHQLIDKCRSIILPGLLERYTAGVKERHYTAEPALGVGTNADYCEELIEIRERSTGVLITVVDTVSPTNKTTESGRREYLNTRRKARESGANLVEIDLVLQGTPMLDYSREGLPDWDYAVTVSRSTHPERYEIYTSELKKRLPRFRLPLAKNDRDTVVDLQAAFSRAYDEGMFDSRIDYLCEPGVPLSAARLAWVAELLKWPTFSHEEIAHVAFQLWQDQGRPEGKDHEHWRLAAEKLRRGCN